MSEDTNPPNYDWSDRRVANALRDAAAVAGAERGKMEAMSAASKRSGMLNIAQEQFSHAALCGFIEAGIIDLIKEAGPASAKRVGGNPPL